MHFSLCFIKIIDFFFSLFMLSLLMVKQKLYVSVFFSYNWCTQNWGKGHNADFLMQAYAHDINTKWQPANKHKVDFYYLEHLWQSYQEWSACGVGVPLRLKNGESVTQYYTPYLSAIQLFTTKALSAPRSLAITACSINKKKSCLFIETDISDRY